jgi:L-rhamnose isomerase
MTTYPPSPREHSPEEAAKLIAEADAAAALADKLRAEARRANAQAKMAELELARAYRADTKALAAEAEGQ